MTGANFYQRVTRLFSGRGGGGSTYAIKAVPAATSRINWVAEAGEIRMNPIVAVCLDWGIRNVHAAPIRLYTRTRLGEEVEIEGHPALDLIKKPNPVYDGSTYLGCLITDLYCLGNAYTYVATNNGGLPGELYWLDGRYVAPDYPTDGSEYMKCWTHTPAGTGYSQKYSQEQVIDIRRGTDPYNDRLGMSPLQACYKDIGMVNLAANYQGAVVKNVGATNIVISPMGDNSISPASAENLRISTQQRVSGDMAGSPLVFNVPTEIKSLGHTPRDLMLDSMDSAAISRICAAFGQSPLLHGLPDSGRTYKNYRESNRSAWLNGIIPMHTLIANALNSQLLPLFDKSGRLFFKWDYQNVEAMAEDQTEQSKRATLLFEKNIATRNESRKIVGLEPVEDGDIFMDELSAAAAPAPGTDPSQQALEPGEEDDDESDDKPEESEETETEEAAPRKQSGYSGRRY